MVVGVTAVASAPSNVLQSPSSKANACLWRSAICPGWGQLHAGSRWKGGIFILCTAALVYAHTGSSGSSSTSRRELNRWSIIFYLYNLGDAYVDGYLSSFDDEMNDLESIGDDLIDKPESESRMELGFGIRW